MARIKAAHQDDRGDARGDRRALLLASGTLGVLFTAGSAVHSAWFYGLLLAGDAGTQSASRGLANLVSVAVDLVLLTGLRIELRRGPWGRASVVVAAAIVAAAARLAAQMAFGVYDVAFSGTELTELVSGFTVTLVANLLGLAYLTSRQRVHDQAHAAADGALQHRLALSALQHEEVRVRRDVAEGLHGSLQQHLVLVTARIDALADRLAAGPASPADVATLHELSGTLNRVRESDVREISRMLYPDGLEVGMVPAVRSLLVRLPATIATRLVVSDAVRRLDDPASPVLSQSERLLAVRVVEEALTNALRHGAASRLEVRLSEPEQGVLRIEVSDDGRGFDVAAVTRSGTARLADRLALVGGRLEVSSAEGAGTLVAATLPVTGSVTGADA